MWGIYKKYCAWLGHLQQIFFFCHDLVVIFFFVHILSTNWQNLKMNINVKPFIFCLLAVSQILGCESEMLWTKKEKNSTQRKVSIINAFHLDFEKPFKALEWHQMSPNWI